VPPDPLAVLAAGGVQQAGMGVHEEYTEQA
jgi:hypothetical protein